MCGRFAQVFEDKDVSRIEEILRAALGDVSLTGDLLLDSFNIASNCFSKFEILLKDNFNEICFI